MRTLAALLMFALMLCIGNAFAEDKATPQQNKMSMCNKAAADKKGDERKAFMSECLKKKDSQKDTQKATQQDMQKDAQQGKMKTCNKEAGDTKGDERKKFMSECLKK
jgi:hypothetical protein